MYVSGKNHFGPAVSKRLPRAPSRYGRLLALVGLAGFERPEFARTPTEPSKMAKPTSGNVSIALGDDNL